MPEVVSSLGGHKCRTFFYIASGVPIVFLHGLSYTIDIWKRIGLTDFLKEKKVPFLAIDMPYGLKSDCQPKTRNVEANIALVRATLLSVFGDASPIVVGSSLGGHMALQYATRFPVEGLLLTSPINALEERLAKTYVKFYFPVRIIYGSEDRVVSLEQMRTLADKLPNSRLRIYGSAGHSAYVNRPDLFKTDLIELYAALEQT